MKRFLNAGLLFLCLQGFAQKDVLDFTENKHDFGVVNENGGPVKHTFKFVNTYDKAIKIANARASCGCTSPSWTREPIAPGDTGFVAAQYNPKGRPGNFNKYVMIYLKTLDHQEKIFIQGYVQSPMKDPARVYKDIIGSLRFKSVNFNMGNVQDDESKMKIFNIFNHSTQPMTVEPLDLPNHVRIEVEPQPVKPNQVANIRLTYDASKVNYYGMKSETIKFKTDDPRQPVKEITLNAEIIQAFSEEEKKDPNRPVISVDDDNKYLGEIPEGDVEKAEFIITNSGKSNLLIHTIHTTCECVATTAKKNKLKPGKSTKIKVKFDASGKSSYVNNRITVITNDPNTPRKELKLRAKVIEKEAK